MNFNRRIEDIERKVASRRHNSIEPAAPPIVCDDPAFRQAFDEFAAEHPIDPKTVADFDAGLEAIKAREQR